MPTDFAYRGYLIRHNTLNGLWWIEKNGHYIATVTDRAHGMKQIDLLTEE